MRKILLASILILSLNQISAQVIHRMQFDRFSHYRIDDWITYAPARFINSIDVGDDYVFFGTRRGGILRYHLYEHYWDYPFTTSNGLSSNRISRVVYDASSQKWYARTNKGIDVYNPGFEYWEKSRHDQLPARRQPDPNEVQEYRQQRNYHFPVFYRPGLAELPDFFGGRDYEFRPPRDILDRDNRLFHLNPERIMDSFRTLWLSTDGLGPVSADPLAQDLKIHPRGLPNISPRDVYFDKDVTWIGGVQLRREPFGITAWNSETDTWQDFEARYISELRNDNIFCISGNRNYVFFGSEDGLLRYDKKNEQWKSFTVYQNLESNRINDLAFLRGELYIATDRGLNRLSPSGSSAYDTDDNKIKNIAIQKILALDSTLILATAGGLYEYFPEKDKSVFFATRSALLAVRVTALNARSDSLWFAGGNGIIFFDKRNDRWTSFTQIQQRLQTVFHDIAFTRGNVWFACNAGLLKYNVAGNRWYLYTKNDGLVSNAVFHIDVDGDDLWLSTAGGVTVFRWLRPGRIE